MKNAGEMANLLKWFKQYALKIAWLIAMCAVVLLVVLRCNGNETATAVTPQLADELQCINQQQLQRVDYEGFRVYYNAAWHLPACVTYELTISESQGTRPRNDNWFTDDSVAGCAASTDYRGSGYDRGHMAPAGDLKWSDQAINQSFSMANACPQSHSLNEGGWQKLEEKVREWVQRDSALIVITGPIVEQGDTAAIGASRVRVPGAFYKIVLAHRVHPMRVAAFVYPNATCNGALQDYAVTVREIERLTGIDFFEALPRDEQDQIETTVNLNPWLN